MAVEFVMFLTHRRALMYWVQYHSIKMHRFYTTGSANYKQCSKAYHKIHYGTISDEALPIGTAKTISSHIPAHVQFLRSYVTQKYDCATVASLCIFVVLLSHHCQTLKCKDVPKCQYHGCI